MFGEEKALPEAAAAARDWLRAVLNVSRDEQPVFLADLKAVLGVHRGTLTTYQFAAEGLARSGRWRAVQMVIEAGQRIFPYSEDLRHRAAEAAEKVAALKPEAAVALPVMVAASAARDDEGAKREDAGSRRRASIGELGARTFQARISGMIERSEWEQAAAFVSEVRSTAPLWWEEVGREVNWLEARIAMGRGDRLAVIGLVTQGLRQNPPPVERALEFARDYLRQGQVDDARRLAGKVLEIVPHSWAAKRFIAEIEAADEKK